MGDILFLAHRVPFPPNRGDKIRAHHLLKKLAQLAPVHVGCFAESDEDRAGATDLFQIAATHRIVNRKKPLVFAGIEAVVSGKPVSLTAFYSAVLEDWVCKMIATHDISTIVIFSGQMEQYVPDNFTGRVMVDLCDVDSAKFENYAASGQRVWLNNREGRLLAKHEEQLARRADATILISEAEAELFRSRLENPALANVQVIGNGIDAEFFDPQMSAPLSENAEKPGPHFVFTGQMDYPPNEAAALWAIDELLPSLQHAFPAAELHIVGRNPTRRLYAREKTTGLTIWGEVPDVRPFLAAANFVIAPLMIARGVQNKVLEAMAMARPVILTPEAATGINARDGEHWLLCDPDPAAMRERINGLSSNHDGAFEMGSAARQFVLDNHDWGAMLAPLEGWCSTQPPRSLKMAAESESSATQKQSERVLMRIPAAWRFTLTVIALGAVAMITVAAREWGEMLHQWWNIDTYTHILLVPIIVGWLIALKFGELAKVTPRAWLPGLIILAAGLGLWIVGRVSEINIIAHAGAVGALQGVVVTALGPRASLILALPIAFATFLIPIGDEFIAPLQAITAEIAVALTHWSGIPAVIDGIYIDTPIGLFVVAEACSGVKFLVAMVTLAVLVSFTRFESWKRRGLFMLASIIVPIIANGIRAWGTIFIAQSQGVEFAAGFDHIFYGWIFFAIVVALILSAAWRFFEHEPEDFGWTAMQVDAFAWLPRLEVGSISLIVAIAGFVGFTIIAGITATIVAPAAIS